MRGNSLHFFQLFLLFNISFFINFTSGDSDLKSKSKEKSTQEEESREIPPSSRLIAFGRDGQLGGFYNYPDDKMGPLSLSFFRGEIPNWMRQETASRFNWSRSVVLKREEEFDPNGVKKKHLKIQDILTNFETKEESMIHYRLNLILGFTQVSERGAYLKEVHDNYAKELVVGGVTFAWGTVYEKLEADWKSVEDRIQFPFEIGDNNERKSNRLAFSHVIMGAQFGAICTVRFRLKLEQENFLFSDGYEDKSWTEIRELEEEALLVKKKEIQGHLEKQMKFLRAKNPEKARELLQKYFKQNPSAPKFQLDIYGDIPVPPSLQMTGSKNDGESQSRVKDVYDVLNFIQQAPKLLRKINGGKGWPISFDIVTIKSILEATDDSASQTKTKAKASQENENGKKAFESAPQPVSL